MAKTEITPAERKKIEALIREGKKQAEICRMIWQIVDARLLDDLVGVAEEYLKDVKQ